MLDINKKIIKKQNKSEKNIYCFQQLANSLLNYIFPPVCSVCERASKEWICNKCFRLLETKINTNSIEQLINKGNYQDNLDNNIYISELMYLFKYEGKIRNLIIDYKFNNKSYIYMTFVKILLKNEKILENIKNYDTMVPVPISRKRYMNRGYNQSFLIAKEISRYVNIECNNKCLYKRKNIVEQSSLNASDRQQNIKGAYGLKNMRILNNKKVLLIDDVYTTGATVNECATLLNEANPSKIGVLTIAKD